MKFTQKIIDQKKANGLIRGYKVISEPKKVARKGVQQNKRGDKAKDWMGWNLFIWCRDRGFTLKKEHFFAKPRLFRFDYYIEDYKIGIEYEGLNSEKSGHTTITGYTSNTDKYNLAATMGIHMIRVTALNYQTLMKTLKDWEAHHLKNHQYAQKRSDLTTPKHAGKSPGCPDERQKKR